MADLAARLEAATEGSRELSNEVLRALYDVNDPTTGWVRVRPDPTRSVDDALALVKRKLPYWDACIRAEWCGLDIDEPLLLWSAYLISQEGQQVRSTDRLSGALALCAALVKAVPETS